MKNNAHALAAEGFNVFPLRPGDKRPLLPGSFKDATRDPAQIEKWWSNHPNANIGVATAGLLVVDLDGEPGKLTGHSWELDGLLPPTYAVQTPHGKHLYYRAPLAPSRATIATGVDVRGEGGYVVGPGSVVEGCQYKVLDCFALVVDAPEALREKVGTFKPAEKVATNTAKLADNEADICRAEAYLQTANIAIAGQGGNATTYKTAAMMRDFGLSEAKAAEVMADWNARCEPPWDQSDLVKIIANAYNYAKGEPADKSATAGIDALAHKAHLDAKANKPEPRWQFLTDTELEALPDPAWQVAKTLTTESIGFLYGPWSSYKSFAAIDLALSVATGTPWLDTHATEQSTVLYVTGEGKTGIKKRVVAWKAAKGHKSIEAFRFSPTFPNFGSVEELKDWGKAVAAISPGLIIIDTMSHAMAGWGDENATKDAATLMLRLYQLRDALKCSVFALHHTGKNKDRGSRGSEEFPQKSDVVLFSTYDKDTAIVTLEMTKQKDAEMWASKLTLAKESHGESLVLRPIKAGVSKSAYDLQVAVWLHLAMTLLGDNGGKAISCEALADAMVAKLTDGQPGNHAPLRQEIIKFLQTSPDLRGRATVADSKGRSRTFA